MPETRFLYFALGVLAVVSLGSVTNQAVPVETATGLSLDDTGLTFPDGSVQSTAAAGRRSYYVTVDTVQGDGVLTACDTGYHAASLWEILDPTQLVYNTVLGKTRADSGEGPPSGHTAWIRTGWNSASTQTNFNSTGDGGFVNCDAWTMRETNQDGTIARLNSCWQEEADCGGISPVIANWWRADEASCNQLYPVWCVEDL